MTATITFTGLGSGTDWTKIVDQLVQVESYRVNQMNTWKTTWQDKIKSIQGLNSRMLSLDQFVQSKNTASEFMATTATSSNTDVLTATSSSTATPGAHSVTVGSDIQDKLASQGVAANSTVVSVRDGTMTIYVGSPPDSPHIHVAVTNGMTLSELQTAIEAADGSDILTAEIIDDGSSSNAKRLSITANTGGSSHLVSITANPTSLTFSEGSINPVINQAGWSGTSQATSSGFYLGSSDKTYTFTVPTVTLNGANGVTSVTWSRSPGGAGNTGSFVIPANYTAGTAIAVDGLVDDATHSSSWSGTSKATSSGNYTGSIDKSYTFTVPPGTVGSGDLTVNWSESTTGRTGTITIPDPYVAGTPINVDGVNSVVEGTWTGSSHATSSGNYTAADNQQYTFTVPTVTLDGANPLVTVNWTKVGGGAGSFDIPANYEPETELVVENGLKVSFDEGGLVNGNTFTVDTEQGPTVSFSDGTLINGDTFSIAARTALKVAFSAGTLVNTEQFYVDTFSNVDSVQEGTWSGASTATSAGHYLGSSNKTFNFSVLNSGTLEAGEIGIVWSDTEGNTSVVTIPSNYTAGTNLDVYQGLKINFTAGDLVAGNTFSIDVYSPQTQKGQDSGLAQVEQVVHSGFIDPGTTKVTAGNAIFSYIYGGKRASVSVAADTTLSGLVNLINNDTANPGVTAGILNDGLGLSTSYHLVLTGRNSGAPYTITNIQDTFTGGTFSSSDFSTTQEAQNSMLKVDGYPPDPSQYIQRSSNSVSDLITGVALSLVGPGTATVGISTDTNAIRTSIEYFVSSINFVLDYIKQETKYNPTTKKAGIMIGNYSYQIVQQRIKDIVTSSIPGLEDGVDPYTHLAQIGINTNPETGKWEINSTTLDNALSTNIEGVKKLFVKDEITGTKDGVLELLTQEMAKLDDSESGPMNILLDNYDGVISNIDKNIETEQKRVDLVKTRLQNQFALLETLLGQLAGQEKSLQSYIDQLPTIGGTTSTSS